MFDWQSWVLAQTDSRKIGQVDTVQTLWGGYGELLRVYLEGGRSQSVILKVVAPPMNAAKNISDIRKRRSYEVEACWYAQHSLRCDKFCRVAQCLGNHTAGDKRFLLLEDLRDAGFYPVGEPSREQIASGLSWLAHFHALFLRTHLDGLWEQGCYWHLDTRQEEWTQMSDGALKRHAQDIDERLKKARFQTVVHGDAKHPNFCWHSDGRVAAVDFQYVGRGCGIRDTALFLSRCVPDEARPKAMEFWLEDYYEKLRSALERSQTRTDPEAVVTEWRELFSVAWTDYARFRHGWANTTYLSDYDRQQMEKALSK